MLQLTELIRHDTSCPSLVLSTYLRPQTGENTATIDIDCIQAEDRMCSPTRPAVRGVFTWSPGGSQTTSQQEKFFDKSPVKTKPLQGRKRQLLSDET